MALTLSLARLLTAGLVALPVLRRPALAAGLLAAGLLLAGLSASRLLSARLLSARLLSARLLTFGLLPVRALPRLLAVLRLALLTFAGLAGPGLPLRPGVGQLRVRRPRRAVAAAGLSLLGLPRRVAGLPAGCLRVLAGVGLPAGLRFAALARLLFAVAFAGRACGWVSAGELPFVGT